ncbi:MAG: hypothetical protein ACHQ5A_05030 [Opitutales bacterium]
MKKTLVLVLLAGVAAYIGLVFFLGSIVKAGVNGFGPRLTKTKVELGAATLSPLTGSGTLSNLVVGNPAGWSDHNAFALGQVHVKVAPFSLFGDHIVIDEILIDGPEFLYETKVVSSNIKDLLKNIDEFSGGQNAGKTPAAKDGKPIKFVVKKFRLTNGVARLGVGAAALPVPLPPISIDDLGVKEGGITPDQLVGVMMKNVLGGIVTGTADALGKIGSTAGATAAEKTKEAAKKASDSVKKLFGGSDKP